MVRDKGTLDAEFGDLYGGVQRKHDAKRKNAALPEGVSSVISAAVTQGRGRKGKGRTPWLKQREIQQQMLAAAMPGGGVPAAQALPNAASGMGRAGAHRKVLHVPQPNYAQQTNSIYKRTALRMP
jgi:hypothetical protein